MDASGKWHLETVTADLMMMYRISEVLHTGKTAYQRVDVLQSDSFGRCLVLDGKTQSTEADEHIYHESLVHPALLAHPQPQSVFIGGGGEGATLREVLAHRSVQHVTMVDLDVEVVDLCRRLLPAHHQGAFSDPRVELLHQDARAYLASSSPQFDVIILDLVDPLEGGPSCLLYTQEFYQQAAASLRPGGILVTQSGPAGPNTHTECFTAIARTLSQVFPLCWSYIVYVPSFLTPWGFVSASNSPHLSLLSPLQFDTLAAERLARPLRFLDGITYQGIHSLPRYIRDGIASEQRTVTDSHPVFMV